MKRHSHFLFACFVIITMTGVGAASMGVAPDSAALTVALTDPESGPSLDVPFVPTSEDIMAEMFRMAGIKKDDIVYDLGCGDGRMVIAAAKRYGVKAVGVDLNPERIRESRQNAARAGVGDRVKFVEGNLFDAEISQATVMLLYLLPNVNLKLRPKLLKELKPGARIVSHDFNMGDWKPDATSKIRGATIHYWVVPANVSGTWEWNLPSKNGAKGTERYVGRFIQKFQEASGGATVAGSKIAVDKVSLSGDRIRFSIGRQDDGLKGPVSFDGHVDGDTIRGKAYPGGEKAGGALPWEATRKAMTIAQIEE